MYETHFGLRERPFPATIDSDYYYPATGHERALSQLQQAIRDDESIALLTGEPGTGKTILCHCLLDRLGDTVASAFLTHSSFSTPAGLLQAVLYDFSLPYEGRSEQELRLSFTDFVLRTYEAGRRILLVLDEAQHLQPALLEELRLLGNLEGPGGRAFQVVLAAQPAIQKALRLPDLAALNQRLAVCARLEPLRVDEAADYLLHHLRAAGGRPEEIVSEEALELLARGTRGIPRLLNRAMHQALTVAFTAGAAMVDAEAALEGLGILGLASSQEESAEGALLAVPTEPEEPDREACAEVVSPEPVRALAEEMDESQERTALPIQEATDPRRLAAPPRRPA